MHKNTKKIISRSGEFSGVKISKMLLMLYKLINYKQFLQFFFQMSQENFPNFLSNLNLKNTENIP